MEVTLRGLDIEVCGTALTSDVIEMIRLHKAGIVAALHAELRHRACAAGSLSVRPPARWEDPILRDRTATFVRQIADWRKSGLYGIPVLALPGAGRHGGVSCTSCGDDLDGNQWRCPTCVKAAYAALAAAVSDWRDPSRGVVITRANDR
jgi:hypothetical protein